MVSEKWSVKVPIINFTMTENPQLKEYQVNTEHLKVALRNKALLDWSFIAYQLSH